MAIRTNFTRPVPDLTVADMTPGRVYQANMYGQDMLLCVPTLYVGQHAPKGGQFPKRATERLCLRLDDSPSHPGRGIALTQAPKDLPVFEVSLDITATPTL